MAMTRGDVIYKCIVIFEAIKRMQSKGNAGLEPEKGAEEEFREDEEILWILREMYRGLQAGEQQKEMLNKINAEYEKKLKKWQEDVIENGAPERLFIL